MADALFGPLAVIKGLILRNHWYSIDSIKKLKYPFLFISCKALIIIYLFHCLIAGKDEIVPP